MTVAMRRSLTMVALCGLVGVGWLALAGPSAGQEGSGGEVDVATLGLYEIQCAPCHGDNGEGGIGPALTSSVLSIEQRAQLIAEGVGGMPSFAAVLSPAEIDDLALLMDRFEVAEIYATQCAPCHGADGSGGIGPSLLTLRTPIEEQIVIVAEGAGAMPAFGPILDAGQLQAVVEFAAGFTSSDAASEEIYVTQCAPCHGVDGEGGVGPSLQTDTLSTPELVAVISFGAGTMPTFGGTLTPTEIEAVARFAESLRIAPPSDEPVDDSELGAAAYAANCAGCHGADATGGSGPGLVGTTLSSDELAEVISGGSGSMPGFGETLAATDIEAIASWIQGLAPPAEDRLTLLAEGAAIFTANCARCHGVDASGDVAPALIATTLTSEEAAAVITSGRAAMPAFGDVLSEDQIEALTVYIEAAVEAAGSSASPPAFTSTEGQTVFRANCATCHGAEAGGGLASALTLGELSANEIISQVYGGHAQGMPAFEGVLSATQVQEVARYILALPETSSSGLTAGTVAVILGLTALVILGALWAAGRIGSPPVTDEESADPSPWEYPRAPEGEGTPPIDG